MILQHALQPRLPVQRIKGRQLAVVGREDFLKEEALKQTVSLEEVVMGKKGETRSSEEAPCFWHSTGQVSLEEVGHQASLWQEEGDGRPRAAGEQLRWEGTRGSGIPAGSVSVWELCLLQPLCWQCWQGSPGGTRSLDGRGWTQ